MPNLLPQLFSLKNLKYTKYSCVFQTLICVKIFGHLTKNQFLEVPCYQKLAAAPFFSCSWSLSAIRAMNSLLVGLPLVLLTV